MKKCDNKCIPACGFCIYSIVFKDDSVFCNLKNTETYFGDYCEDFRCFRVKEEK